MRFKLEFHPLARLDLVEASTWYELREAGLGVRLEREAKVIFRRLTEQALLYAVRLQDIRRVNLRTFPYGVFYFVIQDSAVVLGVLHGARDTEDELKRRRAIYSQS